MRSRTRTSATPSDADGDGDARRRRSLRPLQHRKPSSSPRAAALPTPPREVTAKAVKRRSTKRASTKVKNEAPDVHLSVARPPSPSDDPLLLSGGSRATRRTPPLRARFTPSFSSSPSDPARRDPPVSFVSRLSGTRVGAAVNTPNEDSHSLPVFDGPRIVGDTSGAWSDSDEDDFNLTGEYTGRYTLLTVPTKVDPPARERNEWGRPVSPFPYSEIMERSLPLSSISEDNSGRDDIPIPDEDIDMWEVATEPPLSDVELSPPSSVSEDEFADLDSDLPLFHVDAEPSRLQEGILDSEQTPVEEEEEEAQIDRELSVVADDIPDDPFNLSKAKQPMDHVDGDSSDEDVIEGEDVIKITSGDPKVAARAAAILKMHNYDCLLAAEKKRSSRPTKSTRKRCKTIENAGIAKSYMDLKSQTNSASPSSGSLPLLELWRDAEDAVFLEHHSMSYCDTTFALSPPKATTSHSETPPLPRTGEWTRDCWKCLDKCLASERLAVAAGRGLGADVFADTGDVSKDAVLDRFVGQMGGESDVVGLGPKWSRDNLILRLNVLMKRQSRRRSPRMERQESYESTELRYRGLLQEAMELSGMLDLSSCPDSWGSRSLCGPIRTPSRTPDPKPLHPRDQVHLRHASVPHKSRIPISIQPKRLVDLRHMSPINSDRGGWRSSSRRSSGGSVKDLVRQFESLEK